MISGKGGHLKLNGTTLYVASFEGADSYAELRGTTAAHGGKSYREPGVGSLDVTATIYYDVGTTTLASLKPGTALTNVTLYATNATGATAVYTVPLAAVMSWSFAVEVEGRIEFRGVKIVNQGAYTFADTSA